jgi:23S rRNA (cytosine1962-C5)-methyltransferase
MQTWQLKKGADRRIREKHPWVFSNELAHSPKGLAPGSLVQLLDSTGARVASGYGNPHSLIAFRALSFGSETISPDTNWLGEKLFQAWKYRWDFGLRHSFRLCYGEADGLPGLIIDRFLLAEGQKYKQVLVFQISTYGMEKLVDPLALAEKILISVNQSQICNITLDETAVVLRNDLKIRKLEGLESPPPKAFPESAANVLINARILISTKSKNSNALEMNCNLFSGQKTGFFLDQSRNIETVLALIGKRNWPTKNLRILDLCCYVGQWSAQIAHSLRESEQQAEVHLVDISPDSLAFASNNLTHRAHHFELIEADVLKDLGNLSGNHFDIVICDPPAFIKAKKDVPVGKHAYTKINTLALNALHSGGILVSCSCSGLLEEEDFVDCIKKALKKTNKTAKVLARGSPAIDHPTLMSFPEAHYLKMYALWVE